MAYLLLILLLAGLTYVGWRLMRGSGVDGGGGGQPRNRAIGPDDDPDFLRRLGHEDKDNPRS